MSYQMSWYINNRVLGLRFSGNVTPAEIIATGSEVTAYLPDGIPPLYIIVDARDVTKYPAEVSTIMQGIKDNGNYSASFAQTVVVTDNRLINFLGSVTSAVFNMPIRACKTLEDAEAYLIQLAPALAADFASRHAVTE